MGFLDKLIGAVNKTYDVTTDIERNPLRDRRFERADRLVVEGAAFEAVITGIHYRFNNDTTEGNYRIEWSDPAPRVAGLLYVATAASSALRFGSSIPVRAAGEQAVIDIGLASGAPAPVLDPGRTMRGAPPDPGVKDTGLSSVVDQRIRKWAKDRGTVVSIDRVDLMGLATQNWNVVVTRSDGIQALVKRDFIPPYARWFVFPGAPVPIVVDPDDQSKAQVDWPTLAEENPGGSWRDHPPEGSIAALMPLLATEPDSVGHTEEPIVLTPAAGSADAIEGVTLEQWALIEAALVKDRVPSAQHDDYATAQYGVPAGRWTTVKQQWEQRRNGDWRIGAAFGQAFEKSRKELKKR